MLSPFPGMDPYLEDPAVWQDFHLTLIVALRAEINELLPEGYVAGADRHVWIQDPEMSSQTWRDPDVFVSKTPVRTKSKKSIGRLAIAGARTITLPSPAHKGKPFLKIVDSRDRRVVTVLELLSPTNKTPGDGRNSYLEKREEYFAAGVNLIEINLLRKGKCPPLGKSPPPDYYILVCRATELPRARIWPFSVRQPFPDTPLPLRAGEEVIFNLRPCVDRAYREAKYDVEIDYAGPPEPPLDKEDAGWAENLLRKK